MIRRLGFLWAGACGGKEESTPAAPETSTPTPPTETGPAAAPIQVTATGGVVQPLELTLEVGLAGPVAPYVICVDDTDPDDVHLVEGAATEHQSLTLWGLRPERGYTCTVGAEGHTPTTVAAATGPLPDDATTFRVTATGAAVWGSYTLFNDAVPCFTYDDGRDDVRIVDPEGETRWFLRFEDPLCSIDFDVSFVPTLPDPIAPPGGGFVHVAGGFGSFDTNSPVAGVFRTVDLSGRVVHERLTPDVGVGFNHDSEWLTSGGYLSMTYSLVEDGGAYAVGVQAEVWDPATDSVTWAWDSEAVRTSGQGPAGDAGWVWAANSASFVDDALGPAMYLSVVTTDTLWRVDRDTGALTHILGAGEGWSLVGRDGAPLADDDWFYFQHDPEITADGRILMHDNGVRRPGGDFTRVVEYQVDWATETVTLLWDWTEADWSNPYLGDADRLPDGRVLVSTAYIPGVSSGGPSSVFVLDPITETVDWRLEWDLVFGSSAPYRADRLDGCSIFANAKYCPDVAARVAALLP